jgi:lipoprotein-anchoring transpeptidase ErfK/SrfK
MENELIAARRKVEALRRTVRFVLAAVGAVTTALVTSSNTGWAAIAPSYATTPVASIQPAPGQVVGVVHPVIVTFTKPVLDRAAAEDSIVVTSPNNATGRFTWTNNRVLQWNPDGFWPAHSRISVKAGPLSTEFQTGSAVVAVADISAHTFTVSIDEMVVREMPASMGKPKYPTPVGSFTALQKQRNVTFDSRTIGIPLDDPEGYLIKGEYGVRVTWGGVYVHSAPWSVGSQGSANVSHGCINLSPDNAAWYFDTVSVGDPIIVQA